MSWLFDVVVYIAAVVVADAVVDIGALLCADVVLVLVFVAILVVFVLVVIPLLSFFFFFCLCSIMLLLSLRCTVLSIF